MRAVDAATLIILREGREVLLGCRSAGHVFMPHAHVFPGGRVDLARPGTLPVASITELVLELLRQRLQSAPDGVHRVPLYRQLHGRELIEHH